MTKPLILILCRKISPEDVEYQSTQTALLPFISACKVFGCETLTRYGDLDDFASDSTITDLCRQKILTAVIIIQGESDKHYWKRFAPKLIKNIRANSDTLIIAITGILRNDDDDEENNEPFQLNDCEMYCFLQSKELWSGLKTAIGQKLQALSEDEAIQTQTQQLREAYRVNYPDEEQLSAEDSDVTSARELMRLRLMQDPQLVKQEFDDIIRPHLKMNGVSDWQDLNPTESFDADWEKITEMMADHFKKELIEGCICLIIQKSRGAGLGRDCYGFAYDPKTQSTVVNNAYGLHAYTVYYLRNLVIGLNEVHKIINENQDNDNDRKIMDRFIMGTIYKTEITKTPILFVESRLTETEKQEFWQWARNQRRFIPVHEYDFPDW